MATASEFTKVSVILSMSPEEAESLLSYINSAIETPVVAVRKALINAGVHRNGTSLD